MLHFITVPGNFAEFTRLPEDVKKAWLEATLKELKVLINNQKFLMDDQEKGDTVTPCMEVYKKNIQSDGNIDKLKMRIVSRGYLQNK